MITSTRRDRPPARSTTLLQHVVYFTKLRPPRQSPHFTSLYGLLDRHAARGNSDPPLGLHEILLTTVYQRFLREGCPNCEFLDLTGHNDSVQECTSQVYEGLITLANPSSSWVARWQRLDKYVPGIYAVKVVGNLPDEILQTMEDSGVRYVPRDGSVGDDET